MFVDIFFFFKQKTAYEMRISDWSSDVCSSDLIWLEARKRAAHLERDDGKGEKESDPEASPHIAIFFAGAVRCGRHDRLKCHATDGAASGTGLLDFGMHRAGPDGALGRIGCGRLAFYSIAIEIGLELREAACAAKIMMFAAVRGNVRRGGRVDRHAADWIDRKSERLNSRH